MLALLHHCDEKRAEPEGKALDLPVGRCSLTYGYKGWVITKRMRSWMQAAEMGFLRGVAGISFRGKVRSSVVCEELEVQTLLLCAEWSWLRWFRYLVRMHPVFSLWRCSRHVQMGRGPAADPGPDEEIISPHWSWDALGSPQSELGIMVREREVWGLLLKLSPL